MSIALHNFEGVTCITCHAWNKDKSKIAICPNSNLVYIFKREGAAWKKEETFSEHDSLVTGIDWSPNQNKIVTCSQDRNAYVWSMEGGKWKPSLVILRLNRGCTAVRWSPKEDKFAVGSGAGAVSVCYYVSDNQWWLSKLIKGDKSGINSTISTIAWHPNNILLAAGGTDANVLVFSGFVKDLDDRKAVANGTPFGSRLPFAAQLAVFQTSGWVEAMAFSPSGNQLAWSTHDSSVHFLECSTTNHTIQTVRCRGLPYITCLWVGETSLIAAGHDCVPVLFQGGPGKYQFVKDLDSGEGGLQRASSKNIWEQRTDLGTENAADETLSSRHQNKIIEVSRYDANSFATVSWDGKLVTWPFSACGIKV